MPRKTNVEINGKKYFRVTATVGHKLDGTPIRKPFYGASKREAEAKRDEYKAGIKKGLSVGFDKQTLGAVFDEWFEHVHRPKLAYSTMLRYESDYRLRIKPSILFRMKLSDVKAIDVQRFYNSMLADGTSVNTVRCVHKLLSTFFNYAVKSDLILKSPLYAVELPQVREIKTKEMFLAKQDIKKIVADAKHNPDARIFVFLIFSGLRSGEATALTHADVKNEIIVNKSVKYLTIDGKYQPLLSTTKTTGSSRIVPLFKELLPLMKLHRVYEMEKHFKLGMKFSEMSILFSSSSGGYIEGSNLRRRWARLCKRLDIEKTTIHALRHTFCSLLAENGVSLKTASVLMGHTDTKTTARIYTHVQMEEKERGIATLSAAFPKIF